MGPRPKALVVRRDLSGFQHVHPTIAADGTWRIPMTFATAGDYRAFADFAPAGSPTALTLGTDVAVAGNYVPAALPAPAPTATVDGYTVHLAGVPILGWTSKLTLTVSKEDRPVTDLQPYLDRPSRGAHRAVTPGALAGSTQCHSRCAACHLNDDDSHE